MKQNIARKQNISSKKRCYKFNIHKNMSLIKIRLKHKRNIQLCMP